MRIEEIIPALREGKHARRPDWPDDLSVTFHRKFGFMDTEGNELEFDAEYTMAEDWEFAPEPKRLIPIKMAPALVKPKHDEHHGITLEIYASEEKAKKDYGESFVRWLINTPYELTVEVPDNG